MMCQPASRSRLPQFRHPGTEPFLPAVREVFPGAPEIKGGYMYCNDQFGLGIDLDEKAAARFPYRSPGGSRGNDRRSDGTIVRP